MSTVFDVTGVTIDADVSTSFTVAGVESVTIADVTAPVSVTIDATDVVSGVAVEVPGMQGPPGLQNVYPQLANPALQYGWGPEEAGFIWIEVNV